MAKTYIACFDVYHLQGLRSLEALEALELQELFEISFIFYNLVKERLN